jgi:hypothetical protein
MAIGSENFGSNRNSSGYDNNGSKKVYDRSYYPRLRWRNNDDKLALSATYSGGLLTFEISSFDNNTYTPIEGAKISLSPTKAAMLADEIVAFKKYFASSEYTEGKAFGVNAGMNEKISFIGIHKDESNKILITIGKFDGTGKIVSQAIFKFTQEYNYALEWNNISAMDVERVFYDNVEFDQFANMVTDFARNMNGAIAYSTVDLARYDYNGLTNRFDQVFDKLGIERRSSNGRNFNNYHSNSFLENTSSKSNHVSYDSLSDDIGSLTEDDE